MVEGTGLENRRTGNGTVSSNLTLSVQFFLLTPHASQAVRGEEHDDMLGRVAEWFKAHAWKVCVRETVP